MLSSVSPFIPLFLILANLSSILTQMASLAFIVLKTFKGDNALSPYA